MPQSAPFKQSVGRPEDTVDKELKIQEFSSGTDVFYDPMVTQFSQHRLLLNARSKEGRTLDRRLGYALIGARGTTGGKIYMQSTKQVLNDNDLMVRIKNSGANVQLQTYTSAGGWVNRGAVFGTTADKVDFSSATTVIGGEARTYFTNGVTTLKYTEGTGRTDVTDGAIEILPKFVTSVENILVIANFSGTFGANQLAYSKAGTHQFYKDVDLTFANSSNLITFDGEITGLKTLGSLVYVFTKADGLWELDLNTGIPRVISTHGTTSPKSISVGDNSMIWCDHVGIWGMTINGSVQKLSDAVDNKYKLANFANIVNFNSFITPEGLYVLNIGDITLEGTAYTDYCLIYDIQNSLGQGRHVWYEDDNIPSNCACRWINEVGISKVYFGGLDEDSTFIYESGDNDDSGTITLEWRSKDYILANEKNEAQLKDIYIKAKASTTQDTSFSLYARKDMGTYELIKSFTFELKSDNLTLIRVQGIPLKCRTLGLKLVSEDTSDMRIYEIMVTYNLGDSEIRSVDTTI